MERYHFDLSLELTQGAIHNLGALVLYYHVSASTFLPTRELAKAIIVAREADWSLTTKEHLLNQAEVDVCIEHLHSLGVLERVPQVTAADGNLTGWQHLSMRLTFNGQTTNWDIDLQYGGSSGKDAPAFAALLKHIATTSGAGLESSWLTVR